MEHLPQQKSRLYSLLLFLSWLTIMQVFWISDVLAGPAKSNSVISKQSQLDFEMKITLEQLQKKIEFLKAREDIDEALKKRILNSYYAIQKNLSDWDWYQSQRNLFKERISKAPKKSKLFQQKIEEAGTQKDTLNPVNLGRQSSASIDRLILERKNSFNELDNQLTISESALTKQSDRPEIIRKEIAVARQQIEEAKNNQKPLQKEARTKLETEAQRWFVNSFIEARNAEISMLEAEVISNPYQVQVLKDEVQWLELQSNRFAAQIDLINKEFLSRRQKLARVCSEIITI